MLIDDAATLTLGTRAAAQLRELADSGLRFIGAWLIARDVGNNRSGKRKMLDASDTGLLSVDQLTKLVYELLDAHIDTANLAEELVYDLRWEAHLDYLRDLQRVSRESLAQVADGDCSAEEAAARGASS